MANNIQIKFSSDDQQAIISRDSRTIRFMSVSEEI